MRIGSRRSTICPSHRAEEGGGAAVDAASVPGATSEPEPSPFALLWTSGTSGDASAVPILSSALEASANASVARLGLTERDRWYASLSLGHVGGLALVHRAAHVGCTLLVRGRFSAEVLGELIGREGLTHASLVPTMLRRLLDVRGGGVRSLHTSVPSGSVLRPPVAGWF